MTVTLLPPLPPGFAPAVPPPPRTPHAPAPDAGPALSGVLTTVTARSGADVHLHRADYQRPSVYGGWTLHGYAWRCTSCCTLSRGYEPHQFAAAIGDARDHQCEDTTP